MMRSRASLSWHPQWEGPIKHWATKFIKKNRWRCDRIHELADLMQDAFLTFLKIEAYYPRVVEPQHFMALFKVAMQNALWDHARYMQKKSSATVDIDKDAAEYGAGRIGELTNSGYLHALVAEAPDEVKFALALLSSEQSDEFWAETPRAPYQKLKARENLNMRLNRAYGYKRVKFDFTGAIYSLVTSEGVT